MICESLRGRGVRFTNHIPPILFHIRNRTYVYSSQETLHQTFHFLCYDIS